VCASFWPTPTPWLSPTPPTVPPSAVDRILDLVRPLIRHVGLLKAQSQLNRPPAPPTRPASTHLVLTALKLTPRFTAEQALVTLLNMSMMTLMLWKFLMAATSCRHPSIRLSFKGLLFAAGSIILAITRHIDTRLSHAAIQPIEQFVGGANAILALDLVASLPAWVLLQNSRLSIVSALTFNPHPMLTWALSPPHLQHCSDWEPSTL
jgi:hypothetical protein